MNKNEKIARLIAEGIKSELRDARKDVNTNPTKPQCEAGNYKMGHIRINGFQISIENPKGSYRKGTDPNGKKWSIKMNNDYGYFTRTKGKDGDAIDVFIGPNPESKKIYVVDQYYGNNFDESKVMLGFDSKREAKKAYFSNYERGWKGFGEITGVDLSTFKEWLYDGYRQRKPFYQYKQIEGKMIRENKDPNRHVNAEGEKKRQERALNGREIHNEDELLRKELEFIKKKKAEKEKIQSNEDHFRKNEFDKIEEMIVRSIKKNLMEMINER